jgi:predicted TIM-barrel fold metal-dependent hydrolase
MTAIVDVHHHFIPPVLIAQERDRLLAGIAHMGAPAVLLDWTVARALEEMDKNGIASAMVSIAPPGVFFGDVAKGAALARSCNEFIADAVRSHPGRFGHFAVLPLPDADASLREIAYAFDELGADGIGMLSSYDDVWPGDPTFVPVLEELDRRHAAVYVHATAPACCRGLVPDIPTALLEFPFDTTRAITSLLFSGALSRLRNVRFIFSHAGGAISVLAGRVSSFRDRDERLSAVIPEGVPALLSALHFDIASSTSPASFGALRATTSVTQVLFGSDYPYVPIAGTSRGLAELGLSESDHHAITCGNAHRLFPRLAHR